MYDDPGDDEREAQLMQQESVETWKVWVSILFPVACVGAVAAFLLTHS
jgi:hypothetical protein